jgi:hypothetical protein
MKTVVENPLGRVWMFTLVAIAMFTTGCLVTTAPAPPAYSGVSHAAYESEAAEEPVAMSEEAYASVADYEDTDPSAITEFQGDMAPYGTWVEDPAYGTVWLPDAAVVGVDFAPYVTGGQWAMTDDGDWLWESSYPFGWVTFHYGRWLWLPQRGWAWFPGRRYAHAWVAWRTGYDDYAYVGWAPLPPTYYWSGGVAVRLGFAPPLPYVFCHSHYVFGHEMRGHMAAGAGIGEASRRTRPYHPATASKGSGGQHHFANPTRGPSLREANVPADRAPHATATPHPRAWAKARPAPKSHAAAPSVSRGTPGRMNREVYTSRGASTHFRAATGSSLSASRAPTTTRSASQPVYRTQPHVSSLQRAPAGPSRLQASRSAPVRVSPSPHVTSHQGRSWARPSTSVSSSRPGNSVFSPHSGGSSMHHGGSSTFHAPVHTSRPSYSSGGSRPSGIRSGGGGHSRGGGRRH